MQANSEFINRAINEILERGSRGALATVIDSPTHPDLVGAKIIIEESGERSGSFGDSKLDDAVAQQAPGFLQTREEAKVFAVPEFAPHLSQYPGAKVLFERIDAEPRLIIAGAGHVGGALARLGAHLGYQVTVIDARAERVRRDLFSSV